MSESIFYGITVAGINAALAIIGYVASFIRNGRFFMPVIFGSMTIRVFAVATVIVLLFKFTDLDKTEFSISFAITVFLTIFAEVLFIRNRDKYLNLKK